LHLRRPTIKDQYRTSMTALSPLALSRWVLHGCNLRLRNAIYDWSRVSMQRDSRSREHYHRLRSKGHTHGRALRGLADRLLALLCAMLRSRTTYDPARRQSVGSP